MRSRRRKQPIATRIGDTQVLQLGRRRILLGDPYHFVLTLTWPRFFLLLGCFFIAINLLFGTAYWLQDDSVANARPGNFADHFFFSIETLATVGYGAMAPASVYGHVVASVEILLGMVTLAIMTGLVFARFSKPTARIVFTDRLVVREFDGGRALMLRAANERQNRIVEANASLSLIRTETLADGESFIRIYDLDLIRSRSPVFALTWTLVHRIDEKSPLHGWDQARLAAARARFRITVAGHDETMAATVYAGADYGAEDLAFDSRFADLISYSPEGERTVDMRRFNELVGPGPR